MKILVIWILFAILSVMCFGNNVSMNQKSKHYSATYLTRYGDSGEINMSNFDEIVNRLLNELRTEKFRKPDDEHTQVSIQTDHWFVTAQVSGRITLGNFDILDKNCSNPRIDSYMRDISDNDLKEIWRAVLTNDTKKIFLYKWVPLEQLPKFKHYYYRKTID